MNKEYTYIDKKVIISDENGEKTKRKYYDNLDKVLVQENLIETMEQEIQELEEESEKYKKHNRKHFIPFVFPMIVLMTTIVFPLLMIWAGGSNCFATSVDTIFGPMNQAIAYGILSIPVSVVVELVRYNIYKTDKKIENGINSELFFLKKQIETEKEELKKLKKDKSRDNKSNEFRTVKIDDLQQLKILREYLCIYFDLGYNEKKYYQYYQQGKLDRKLQRYYSDTEIQVAKKYMKKKEPF